MRTTIITGLIAAATLTTAPAFAESRSGTPAPTASSSPSEGAIKDKRYCVVNTYTGTRLPRKTCKTRAQWMEQDGFDPLDQK